MLPPRFQLLDCIAETKFSEVFHAWDRETNTAVALKRARGEEGRAQLRNEERALSALKHVQGVPQLVMLEEFEQTLWLAREWVAGESLDGSLIDPSEASRVFHDLRAIVEAIHRAGLVHGDLNDRNVILASDGKVRLIDFGNASALGSAVPNTIGSIHHMAPELFDHQLPSPRTDLYALGVIGYKLATGRYPFDGETKAQIITAHLRHEPETFDHPLCAEVMLLLKSGRCERS